MEKARAAVKDLTSRAGKHDTTVHESVNPAVTNEQVTPTRHEEAQAIVDKEVHQDHHHTTIQPVQHREVLPEQHTHQQLETQHKEYNHNDSSRVKERLDTEAAQFKDTTSVGSTRQTASTAPTVGGEHVHHHVHETIQPVIQKETIQPSVVHTTVPVHEVHHNEAKHHATSALPAVSMADFKQGGGSLTGRADRTDRFEGEPRGETATNHRHQHQGGDVDGARTAGATGIKGRADTGDSGYDSAGVGSKLGMGRSNADAANQRTGGMGREEEVRKPGLLEKLNPMRDADGDGKKGLMD